MNENHILSIAAIKKYIYHLLLKGFKDSDGESYRPKCFIKCARGFSKHGQCQSFTYTDKNLLVSGHCRLLMFTRGQIREKCNLRKLKYQGKLFLFLLTVFVSPYTDWRASWTLSCRCVCRYLNRVLSVFVETSQHSVINICGENAYTAIVDVNVVTYDHSVRVAWWDGNPRDQ